MWMKTKKLKNNMKTFGNIKKEIGTINDDDKIEYGKDF